MSQYLARVTGFADSVSSGLGSLSPVHRDSGWDKVPPEGKWCPDDKPQEAGAGLLPL